MDGGTPTLRGGDGFGAYRGVRDFLIGAMIVTLLTALPFALQSSSLLDGLAVATVAAAIGAAALAGGVLVGFIFGIPRSLQEDRPAATPTDAAGATTPVAGTTGLTDRPLAYAGNTSLEQISDWLTNILVGF